MFSRTLQVLEIWILFQGLSRPCGYPDYYCCNGICIRCLVDDIDGHSIGTRTERPVFPWHSLLPFIHITPGGTDFDTGTRLFA